MVAAAVIIPIIYYYHSHNPDEELRPAEHEIICLNWGSNPSPLILDLTFLSFDCVFFLQNIFWSRSTFSNSATVSILKVTLAFLLFPLLIWYHFVA